jgi:hypothetical protein
LPQRIDLGCEQLLRFTAVVVVARCVGFSDSGIGELVSILVDS